MVSEYAVHHAADSLNPPDASRIRHLLDILLFYSNICTFYCLHFQDRLVSFGLITSKRMRDDSEMEKDVREGKRGRNV